MKPRHVKGPLPANLVFRTAVRSAGVGGKENADTVSYVSPLAYGGKEGQKTGDHLLRAEAGGYHIHYGKVVCQKHSAPSFVLPASRPEHRQPSEKILYPSGRTNLSRVGRLGSPPPAGLGCNPGTGTQNGSGSGNRMESGSTHRTLLMRSGECGHLGY